ncbi:hypothetical protein MPSEU_000332200 [Mayamaea pseudoterrestris]|nr:hypothetical protein MPSEU_000332200 [Mayamaea pseudoterrestris]
MSSLMSRYALQPLSRIAKVTAAPSKVTFVGRRLDIIMRNNSSVSSKEVEKFSALDDSWWDAKKNPLIHMNAIRIQYIRDMILKHHGPDTVTNDPNQTTLPLSGLHALDIGCGGGLACESLARLGATCTTAEELAAQHAEGFDVICLLEVIEHVTDVSSLLQTSSKLLKPNGLLFISTINRTMKSYLLTILGAEYIMKYIPVGTHDWNKYCAPSEVESLMAAANTSLQQVNVTGMVLNKPPLFGNWDWKLDANDTDVNWIGTYVKRRT